ncbi:MAG: SPOR domain-containing protein, partial [Deltaproteobacteria bacterium]|nr:SPOR domain-containing protein [Deltaproteobacteria bacterium]
RGFFPGKVTTISDLRTQIQRLQEMVTHKSSKEMESIKKSEPDPKLAFYEKLSSKKDEAKKDRQIEKKREIPKKKPPQKKIEISEKPRVEKKKTEGPKVPVKPPKPLTDEFQYTVQVASLDDKSKADKMIKQLIDAGLPAYHYKAKVKGKIYYRIRCGKFMNREEARIYAGKLVRENGIKGFVSKIE